MQPPPRQPIAAYLVKEPIPDIDATGFAFPASKTMYGGKRIAVGDTAYLFASETQGGPGLIARGTVTVATRLATINNIPRVAVEVGHLARAMRPFGRADLKPFDAWQDGQPQTELNFKFYRQATNKIGGISADAAAFLDTLFPPDPA